MFWVPWQNLLRYPGGAPLGSILRWHGNGTNWGSIRRGLTSRMRISTLRIAIPSSYPRHDSKSVSSRGKTAVACWQLLTDSAVRPQTFTIRLRANEYVSHEPPGHSNGRKGLGSSLGVTHISEKCTSQACSSSQTELFASKPSPFDSGHANTLAMSRLATVMAGKG